LRMISGLVLRLIKLAKKKRSSRHRQPTGRAYARPMTGCAKQFILTSPSNGLLRRGVYHRAALRADPWLLAMAAYTTQFNWLLFARNLRRRSVFFTGSHAANAVLDGNDPKETLVRFSHAHDQTDLRARDHALGVGASGR